MFSSNHILEHIPSFRWPIWPNLILKTAANLLAYGDIQTVNVLMHIGIQNTEVFKNITLLQMDHPGLSTSRFPSRIYPSKMITMLKIRLIDVEPPASALTSYVFHSITGHCIFFCYVLKSRSLYWSYRNVSDCQVTSTTVVLQRDAC